MNISIYRDGQQLGPYALEDVRAQIDDGTLAQDTDLAWHEGLTEWLPLRQVLENLADPGVPAVGETEPPAETGPAYHWTSDVISPSKLAAPYQLGLALVAVVMVLLPVLYLALCAAVGFGIFAWMMGAVFLLALHQVGIALYLAVPIAGIIALVFLIKPLFHVRKKRDAGIVVTRADQPQLFAFIDEICRRVKAPRPVKVRIDAQVNASASFEYGWLGMLTNRLVLTIGAPLADGLTVAQLGGVIAHEFGHFTQAAAMRFSYVTRSMNGWFARVIYERDSMDAKLEVWASRGHIYRILMANIARAFVWIARRFLWLLMRLGLMISSFLMRQMEYDADHYERQIAGGANFKETFVRLRVGNLGLQAAANHVGRLKAERRLVDNIPLLVHGLMADIPEKTLRSVRDALDADRSVAQRYATHPTDFERLSRAVEGPEAGALQGDGPALALFANYEALAKKLTLAVYEKQLEVTVKPGALQPTAAFLEEVSARNQRAEAVHRFLGGLLSDRRLLFPVPAPGATASTFDEAKSQFDACTRQLLDHAAAIETDAGQVAELRAKRANAIGAQILVQYRIPFNLDLGLPDRKPATIAKAIEDYSSEISALERRLAPHFQTAEDKLFWFCRLAEFPETAAMPQAARVTQMKQFLLAIHPIQHVLEPSRKPLFVAGVYAGNYQASKDKKDMDVRFKTLAVEFAQVAGEVGRIAARTMYPFKDGEKPGTLHAYFLVGNDAKGPMGHFLYLRSIFERYNVIYMRAMQELLEEGAGLASLQEMES